MDVYKDTRERVSLQVTPQNRLQAVSYLAGDGKGSGCGKEVLLVVALIAREDSSGLFVHKNVFHFSTLTSHNVNGQCRQGCES
jgi:hypothetical protein